MAPTWFAVSLHSGERIPHTWLGFAYHEYDTATARYMVMPLNRLAALARERWFAWRHPIRTTREEAEVAAYQRGFQSGYARGRASFWTGPDVLP
jgi:hypothetical protein